MMAVDFKLEQSKRRFTINWDSILRKYDKPFEDDDVLDLTHLQVVQNNGHLERTKPKEFGSSRLKITKRRVIFKSDTDRVGFETISSHISDLYDSAYGTAASDSTCSSTFGHTVLDGERTNFNNTVNSTLSIDANLIRYTATETSVNVTAFQDIRDALAQEIPVDDVDELSDAETISDISSTESFTDTSDIDEDDSNSVHQETESNLTGISGTKVMHSWNSNGKANRIEEEYISYDGDVDTDGTTTMSIFSPIAKMCPLMQKMFKVQSGDQKRKSESTIVQQSRPTTPQIESEMSDSTDNRSDKSLCSKVSKGRPVPLITEGAVTSKTRIEKSVHLQDVCIRSSFSSTSDSDDSPLKFLSFKPKTPDDLFAPKFSQTPPKPAAVKSSSLIISRKPQFNTSLKTQRVNNNNQPNSSPKTKQIFRKQQSSSSDEEIVTIDIGNDNFKIDPPLNVTYLVHSRKGKTPRAHVKSRDNTSESTKPIKNDNEDIDTVKIANRDEDNTILEANLTFNPVLNSTRIDMKQDCLTSDMSVVAVHGYSPREQDGRLDRNAVDGFGSPVQLNSCISSSSSLTGAKPQSRIEGVPKPKMSTENKNDGIKLPEQENVPNLKTPIFRSPVPVSRRGCLEQLSPYDPTPFNEQLLEEFDKLYSESVSPLISPVPILQARRLKFAQNGNNWSPSAVLRQLKDLQLRSPVKPELWTTEIASHLSYNKVPRQIQCTKTIDKSREILKGPSQCQNAIQEMQPPHQDQRGKTTDRNSQTQNGTYKGQKFISELRSPYQDQNGMVTNETRKTIKEPCQRHNAVSEIQPACLTQSGRRADRNADTPSRHYPFENVNSEMQPFYPTQSRRTTDRNREEPKAPKQGENTISEIKPYITQSRRVSDKSEDTPGGRTQRENAVPERQPPCATRSGRATDRKRDTPKGCSPCQNAIQDMQLPYPDRRGRATKRNTDALEEYSPSQSAVPKMLPPDPARRERISSKLPCRRQKAILDVKKVECGNATDESGENLHFFVKNVIPPKMHSVPARLMTGGRNSSFSTPQSKHREQKEKKSVVSSSRSGLTTQATSTPHKKDVNFALNCSLSRIVWDGHSNVQNKLVSEYSPPAIGSRNGNGGQEQLTDEETIPDQIRKELDIDNESEFTSANVHVNGISEFSSGKGFDFRRLCHVPLSRTTRESSKFSVASRYAPKQKSCQECGNKLEICSYIRDALAQEIPVDDVDELSDAETISDISSTESFTDTSDIDEDDSNSVHQETESNLTGISGTKVMHSWNSNGKANRIEEEYISYDGDVETDGTTTMSIFSPVAKMCPLMQKMFKVQSGDQKRKSESTIVQQSRPTTPQIESEMSDSTDNRSDKSLCSKVSKGRPVPLITEGAVTSKTRIEKSVHLQDVCIRSSFSSTSDSDDSPLKFLSFKPKTPDDLFAPKFSQTPPKPAAVKSSSLIISRKPQFNTSLKTQRVNNNNQPNSSPKTKQIFRKQQSSSSDEEIVTIDIGNDNFKIDPPLNVTYLVHSRKGKTPRAHVKSRDNTSESTKPIKNDNEDIDTVKIANRDEDNTILEANLTFNPVLNSTRIDMKQDCLTSDMSVVAVHGYSPREQDGRLDRNAVDGFGSPVQLNSCISSSSSLTGAKPQSRIEGVPKPKMSTENKNDGIKLPEQENVPNLKTPIFRSPVPVSRRGCLEQLSPYDPTPFNEQLLEEFDKLYSESVSPLISPVPMLQARRLKFAQNGNNWSPSAVLRQLKDLQLISPVKPELWTTEIASHLSYNKVPRQIQCTKTIDKSREILKGPSQCQNAIQEMQPPHQDQRGKTTDRNSQTQNGTYKGQKFISELRSPYQDQNGMVTNETRKTIKEPCQRHNAVSEIQPACLTQSGRRADRNADTPSRHYPFENVNSEMQPFYPTQSRRTTDRNREEPKAPKQGENTISEIKPYITQSRRVSDKSEDTPGGRTQRENAVPERQPPCATRSGRATDRKRDTPKGCSPCQNAIQDMQLPYPDRRGRATKRNTDALEEYSPSQSAVPKMLPPDPARRERISSKLPCRRQKAILDVKKVECGNATDESGENLHFFVKNVIPPKMHSVPARLMTGGRNSSFSTPQSKHREQKEKKSVVSSSRSGLTTQATSTPHKKDVNFALNCSLSRIVWDGHSNVQNKLVSEYSPPAIGSRNGNGGQEQLTDEETIPDQIRKELDIDNESEFTSANVHVNGISEFSSGKGFDFRRLCHVPLSRTTRESSKFSVASRYAPKQKSCQECGNKLEICSCVYDLDNDEDFDLGVKPLSNISKNNPCSSVENRKLHRHVNPFETRVRKLKSLHKSSVPARRNLTETFPLDSSTHNESTNTFVTIGDNDKETARLVSRSTKRTLSPTIDSSDSSETELPFTKRRRNLTPSSSESQKNETFLPCGGPKICQKPFCFDCTDL